MIRRLAFAIVFVLAAGASALAADVVVRDEAVIDGATIRLGDVASNDLNSELASIELASAPEPGRDLTLSGAFIAARVRQVAGKDVVLQAPDKVDVERRSQTLEWDAVEAVVRDFLIEKRAVSDHDLPEAEISFPRQGRPLTLPTGPITVHPVDDGEPAKSGRQTVPVLIQVGDSYEEKANVDVFVDAPETVHVARHNIARGRVITQDDLTTKTIPATKVRGRVVREQAPVVGRVARKAISAGEVLRETAIEAAPVVKRGDVVTLVVQSPTIVIKAFAAVEEDGALGETIQVRNLDTEVTVRAVVADAKTVRVEL
ncbi:MAG: flagellar basal body P-ring formation protein FlgA [Deltaproteobacteria bacterium]|nr:flagellar basal body P-ring formation protein FlgA [Deltaproteobacteria bacterium]